MWKNLCPECQMSGVCKTMQTRIVTDKEMDDPEFIRDVRANALAENIPAAKWLDHLYDLYCGYIGTIIDAQREEVMLDLDRHFDDDDAVSRRRIINWFSEVCCSGCATTVKPRVRREARERFRILATLLRATHPKQSMMWGRRPANDNSPAAGNL